MTMIYPASFKQLSKTKQKTSFAGEAEIPMSQLYLSKIACEVKGYELFLTGAVKNMAPITIAQEIFAHACAYYASSVLVGLGIDNATIQDMYNRANPINIDDHPDTPKRLAAYGLIWLLSPQIVLI